MPRRTGEGFQRWEFLYAMDATDWSDPEGRDGGNPFAALLVLNDPDAERELWGRVREPVLQAWTAKHGSTSRPPLWWRFDHEESGAPLPTTKTEDD